MINCNADTKMALGSHADVEMLLDTVHLEVNVHAES